MFFDRYLLQYGLRQQRSSNSLFQQSKLHKLYLYNQVLQIKEHGKKNYISSLPVNQVMDRQHD